MVYYPQEPSRRSIMIQTVITHHCTKCNSTNIVKNGTDYKGGQKFHENLRLETPPLAAGRKAGPPKAGAAVF
jgi:hypothetical protein